jgi:hypothetical protein
MKHFDIEIRALREETKRKRIILDMAIHDGRQGWAIPYLQEQLKTSEELLAFASKRASEPA